MPAEEIKDCNKNYSISLTSYAIIKKKKKSDPILPLKPRLSLLPWFNGLNVVYLNQKQNCGQVFLGLVGRVLRTHFRHLTIVV